MLGKIYELFTGKLSLEPDIWLYAMLAVVVLAFVIALVIGLASGEFVKTKSVMKLAVARPATALAALKKLPAGVKTQYKNARMGNIKPSVLLTKQACVDEPYKRSFLSKLWRVTLIATAFAAAMAWCLIPLSKANVTPGGDSAEDLAAAITAAAKLQSYVYIAPLVVLLVGGILTIVGGIIGKASYAGAVKLYGKFMPVIDGDQRAVEAGQAYSEPQKQTYDEHAYAEPQQAYAEPQQAYAEPQQAYAEPQQVYAEPQQVYAEPQQAYAEPQAVVTPQPQESDEEIRRKAREEALARARAQQAQAQAQAQATQSAQPQQQAFAGNSSADEVVARINQIEREGATREVMREVATQLQKERAKPENKTPERQKQLNDALSKLLKAMSGARK